jgi:hypothetical protein
VKTIDYRRLDLWEEACGQLQSIKEKDGLLIAKISGIRIVLPTSLKTSLLPLVKQRIAVLRTDIRQKEYLIRATEGRQE